MLGLNAVDADYRIPLRIGAKFGTTYSAAGWGQAMTILTCSASMLPYLEAADRPLAMYQGLLHVARANAGMAPRFLLDPLPTGETRAEVFKLWLRNFIDVRDSDGAERCLRTAIEIGVPEQTIADMIFAAITDHVYIDGGHTLDFANKAFELLDHLGWEHAGRVLTSLVRGTAGARRSEELSSWRNPIDISTMVWKAREALATAYEEGASRRGEWDDENALVDVILEDDPAATLDAMVDAVRSWRERGAGRLGGGVCGVRADGALPHIQRVQRLGYAAQHADGGECAASGIEARAVAGVAQGYAGYGDERVS